MRRSGNGFTYSATDLVGYLECGHLSRFDRAQAAGLIAAPLVDDPVLDRIAKRGELHEQRFLGSLIYNGHSVTEIALDESLSYEARLASGRTATLAAMRAGDEVIYQAVLDDGRRTGFADFLRRVEMPSSLGSWSYEVWDTKLARHAKASAVLQLCMYSDLVGQIQGAAPANMHLALGGIAGETVSFRVADFAAYYRYVAASFEAFLETGPVAVPDSSPDPVSHCDVCRWSRNCTARWRADDDLALVANLDSRHRLALLRSDISTRTALAGLPDGALREIPGIGRTSLRRARDQAEIQVRGQRRGKVISNRLEPPRDADGSPVPDHGLLMLPEPSGGDLFVDFEGDPFFESADADGIEYLFGALEPAARDANGEPAFHSFWATERDTVTTAGERRAFEAFIDLVIDRLEKDPNLHVYHYAPYEPATVKQLAGRYNTREREVDRLLRGRVFVDLYRAVRQGVRASVESYSIKRLEPLYGFTRKVDLREAGRSIVEFETWLELDNQSGGAERAQLQESIRLYNRDDCLSTFHLRNWLEDQRGALESDLDSELPRPVAAESDQTEDSEQQQEFNRLAGELLAGLPADPREMDRDQRAVWLLAQLLNWHRREDKGFWWRYFHLLNELSHAEYREEGDALGELRFEQSWPDPKPGTRSTFYRFRFPPQDHDIKPGSSPRDPDTEASVGTVAAIDDEQGTIDIRRGDRYPAPSPRSLIPFDYVSAGPKPESLFRLATWVRENAVGAPGPSRVGRDLLRRREPGFGQAAGQPLVREGENAAEAARRLALQMDRTYLAVQGPPGSGKSTVGAQIIADLAGAGKKIGVTANSHKVISELLAKVVRESGKKGLDLRIAQRTAPDQVPDGVTPLESRQAVEALAAAEFDIVGGTTWLWAREDVTDRLEVLVIDEAGQMSLADALSASPCADSLILLGDPQQLNQPLKGVHPPGAERSVLGHVLDGERVIPPHLGVFLDGTWRMHPQISAYTSEVFYEGQLGSHPGRECQQVRGAAPLSDTGVRFVAVPHAGNSSSSPEEAAKLRELITALLESDPAFTDADGVQRSLEMSDVLVITPFNAQVAQIGAALRGVRVGTVDKFQGQEAPISIYSMATSSAADAPRGMEFLYNLNRLNVATSRAQGLAVIVGSRALLQARCRTPRQMRLANALARFIELADSAD